MGLWLPTESIGIGIQNILTFSLLLLLNYCRDKQYNSPLYHFNQFDMQQKLQKNQCTVNTLYKG